MSGSQKLIPPEQAAGIMYLIVDVPLPPRELQVNNVGGANRFSLGRHKDRAKADVRRAFSNDLGLPDATVLGWRGCKARAHFTFTNPARRDEDNLQGWLKWTRDEIARCLGFDDKHFIWEDLPTQHLDRTVDESVKIELMRNDNV